MRKRTQLLIISLCSIVLSTSFILLASAQEEPEPLFTLKWLYDTASKNERDMGTLLQIEYAKIGINLELVGLESATASSRVWGLEGWPTYPTHDEGGFDLTYMAYYWIPTDLVYFIGCYNTEGIPYLGWNFWAAHDGRADIWLRESMATYNHTKRLDSIYKWQDQKQAEVNEIQLSYANNYAFMDPKLNRELPVPDRDSYYLMDRWTYEGMTQSDDVIIKAAYSEDPRYWLLMYGDGGFAPTMPQHRMLFSVIYNEAEKQFKIEPELVTDWELSEDGMSMTLQLRQDAVFHDGHPLTSADVKWTYDAILDPASGSTYWGDFSAAIESVEAPDDYTVILNFKKETPEILTLLAPTGGYTSIYPEHILGDIPHDQLRTSEYNTVTPPPGLGPMKFSDWKSMEFIKLEAFDDYYGGRPLVDEYILEIIPAAETALAALESGEVHLLLSYLEETLVQVPRLREEGKISIETWPRDGVRFIAINNDHPILVNKFVRQALAYATPYQSLIDNVWDGDGIPANSPISPNMWAYKADTKYYEYDLDKAREALIKAGYPEWPPEVVEEQQADILVPAAGGLVGGIIIGVAVMYFLRRDQ